MIILIISREGRYILMSGHSFRFYPGCEARPQATDTRVFDKNKLKERLITRQA